MTGVPQKKICMIGGFSVVRPSGQALRPQRILRGLSHHRRRKIDKKTVDSPIEP